MAKEHTLQHPAGPPHHISRGSSHACAASPHARTVAARSHPRTPAPSRLRTAVVVVLLSSIVPTVASVSDAREVVAIRMRGYYYSEPATVQVTVAVEPAASNRALRIEADGERYFRSSEVTLSGESEKRLHSVEFRNLPAGSYLLRAVVRSSDSVLGQATQELFVTGIGGR
jgi:hypothetical protein